MGSIDTYPAGSASTANSVLGYAQVTSNQSGITTIVDLTGLSVTVSVPVGRTIRITGEIEVQSTVANDVARLAIQEGATNFQVADLTLPLANITGKIVTHAVISSPAVGVHTYKLTLFRIVGTGSLTMNAANPPVGSILVEDITGGTGGSGPIQLAYTEVTTDQTGITTQVDLTGLSATFSVPAGRRIKITGYVSQFTKTSGTATYVQLLIYEGATQLNKVTGGATAYEGVMAQHITTPTAGTHTYKLRSESDATITMNAAATYPAYILVEDITGTPSSGIVASEAWTLYTPTWVAGGTAVSLGNGTLLGRYIRLGRTIIGAIYFSPGSTTTFGTGAYTWALPVAPSNSIFSFQIIGNAKGYSGGSNCNAVATVNGGTQFVRAVYSATWPAGTETAFGQLTPWTWASGNDMTIHFTYEAAT